MKTVTKVFKQFGSILLLAGVLVLAGSLPFVASASSEEVECQIADQAIRQASVIRGLEIKHDVPCFVRNREQIEAYLIETINEKIPEEKFALEEYVYKKIGLLPAEFDYRSGLIDLYMSQIGGYYDPERKHFVMAGWMPRTMQSAIAVHELTHALQDQYFDLSAFMDIERYSSDEIFARSALVEGDATAVMMDYVRDLAGQPALAETTNVESLMLQNVVGASMMDGFSEVPESLQRMVLFPYISGLRFAHDLLRRGGYEEINRAMEAPPRSTEEILHPEKFFQAEPDFIRFSDEEMLIDKTLKEAEIVFDDTLGEIMISALLGANIDDKAKAAQAAAGWGGDRLIVFAGEAGENRVLVWKLNWDTEEDSQEFFLLYKEILGELYSDFSRLNSRVTLAQESKVTTLIIR